LRKKDGFNIRQASGIFLINSEAETKVLGESCWPADYSIYDIGPMDSGTNIYLTHKPLSTDFLGSLKKILNLQFHYGTQYCFVPPLPIPLPCQPLSS
jgi:hypothetical protein